MWRDCILSHKAHNNKQLILGLTLTLTVLVHSATVFNKIMYELISLLTIALQFTLVKVNSTTPLANSIVLFLTPVT